MAILTVYAIFLAPPLSQDPQIHENMQALVLSLPCYLGLHSFHISRIFKLDILKEFGKLGLYGSC